MKTVLEVVEATSGYFARHGVDGPRLNAELLIAHALGKKRLDLYLEFDRPLGEGELEPARELIRRRAKGVPLQHLLGSVEFYGREFLCDGRALIPRPETEQLIGALLAHEGLRRPAPRIVDVGTGSGVIALSLAAELPEAEVTGVDLSPEALSLAAENAARLGFGTGPGERVCLLASDLLSGTEGEFDLIVANLPYIAAGEIDSLSREVRHDPRSALDGGPRGTELIEALIAAAPARLRPGGLLALEIGHDQAAPLAAALERHHYRDIRSVADYQGVLRFLFASYG